MRGQIMHSLLYKLNRENKYLLHSDPVMLPLDQLHKTAISSIPYCSHSLLEAADSSTITTINNGLRIGKLSLFLFHNSA